MKLGCPTVYADCMVAKTFEAGSGRNYKLGEIVRLPYAAALQLKAMGAVSAFVDETQKHAEAIEQLAIYGGDCWFQQDQQTMPRVLDAMDKPEGSA